jgi:hypothetical protein
VVTRVPDAIDALHDLAPTGGNVLDLGRAAPTTSTSSTRSPGSSPTTPSPTTRSRSSTSAEYVAVIVRGHSTAAASRALTRYEPGRRSRRAVRSELFNGGPDVHAGSSPTCRTGASAARAVLAAAHQGYVQPELDLLELTRSTTPSATAPRAAPTARHGVAACTRAGQGINDLELSRSAPRQLSVPARPWCRAVWIAAGPGSRSGAGDQQAIGVREQTVGDPTPIVVTGRIVAEDAGFGGTPGAPR